MAEHATPAPAERLSGRAPAAARRGVASSGAPLDAVTAREEGARLGADLTTVRVHTDSAARASARDLGALAYTLGNHVVVGDPTSGGPSPQAVLRHELVHVAQQHGGARGSADMLEAQARQAEGAPGVAGGVGRSGPPTLRLLLRPGDALRLTLTVDGEQAEVRLDIEGADPVTGTGTAAGLDPGTYSYDVASQHISLPTGEVLPETVRFDLTWGPRGEDAVAALERVARVQLVVESATLAGTARDGGLGALGGGGGAGGGTPRERFRALPERIRAFFTGGITSASEDDYEVFLRIADRIGDLSDAELAEYRQRTTGVTHDVRRYERGVYAWLEEVRARREAAREHEEASRALYGLEGVYRLYRAWGHQLMAPGGPPDWIHAAEADPDRPLPDLADLEGTGLRTYVLLRQALAQHGIGSVTEFTSRVRRFVAAFRSHALYLGLQHLGMLEHVLTREQRRYRGSGEARALHRAVAPARRRYAQAEEYQEQAQSSYGSSWDPAAVNAYYAAGPRYQEMRAEADALVRGLEGEHPLLGQRGFPREELARASELRVGQVMSRYIAQRLRDVRETRNNLTNDPEMVFGLGVLVEEAKRAQGITDGSVWDMALTDHQAPTIEESVRDLAVVVLAIALGLVSGGTGTVAVLAGAGAFGLGAYEAWNQYREWEEGHAAYGAQLLSDDPSFTWVVVAVVGAGLDLAQVGAALRSLPVREALTAFNRGEEVAELSARLERLSEVDDELRRVVVEGARREVAAREAWDAARAARRGRMMGYVDPIVTPLLHLAAQFAYPVYLSVRRGVVGFRRFLLTREAASILGDVHRLDPAQLARVRQAYEQALLGAQRVAAHGHAAGMLDSELERLLRLWGEHPELSAEDVMRQIDQWAEPLRARAGARARIAPDMVMSQQTREVLSGGNPANVFDQQIAGTGGIERITASRLGEHDALSVTIEGEILLRRLARRPEDVSETRRAAPDFNRSGSLFTRSESGLGPEWERLHLWGPGFGDEAAAGLMWGPRSLNQVWQRQGIEAYIRELAEQASIRGGSTRVRATAVSWGQPPPGSAWRPPQGQDFLRQVEYRVTVLRPSGESLSVRVTIDVPRPPSTGRPVVSFDPQHAVNPAALFE